jgi:hypothetical protein
MARTGTNSEVIQAFFDREEKPYTNRNGSIFFQEYDNTRVLYSYGTHFALAVMTDDYILLNGDRYSATTSSHQSAVRRAAPDSAFTTSFDMLARGPLIDVTRVPIDILNTTDEEGQGYSDDSFPLSPVPEERKEEYKEILRKATRITRRTSWSTGRLCLSAWHRAGYMLFAHEEKYYIAGQDEQQYFVSEIVKPEYMTVNSGLNALKPKEVRNAERANKEVHRQGDWFFVKMDVSDKEAKKAYKTMAPKIELRQDDNESSHIATRACHVLDLVFDKVHRHVNARDTVVSGQIRHPQHAMLKLSLSKNPKLFLAYPNNAIRSWSADAMGVYVD